MFLATRFVPIGNIWAVMANRIKMNQIFRFPGKYFKYYSPSFVIISNQIKAVGSCWRTSLTLDGFNINTDVAHHQQEVQHQ